MSAWSTGLQATTNAVDTRQISPLPTETSVLVLVADMVDKALGPLVPLVEAKRMGARARARKSTTTHDNNFKK